MTLSLSAEDYDELLGRTAIELDCVAAIETVYEVPPPLGKGYPRSAIEVKSFSGISAISEFHTASGQFISYRTALRFIDSERTLYLAVPDSAYRSFFSLELPQLVIQENQLKLFVYSIEQEVILQWLD